MGKAGIAVRSKKRNTSPTADNFLPLQILSPSTFFPLIIAFLVCSAGCFTYVSNLFESDVHFSHLSTMERELYFRTELGLYYSYFKTIIDAPSFLTGVNYIMNDNLTEYPDTINTLKRFNLYPEVVIAAAYRIYEDTSRLFNHQMMMCYKVNRGDLPPVQSCEGLGEPAYFYIHCVFALHGIQMAAFFFFGKFLSESWLGGLVGLTAYMFNHGECTRVMWTPPLRESFGGPCLFMQAFAVTCLIKSGSQASTRHTLLVGSLSLISALFWQFTQFVLLTQTLAVTATYILTYINSQTLKIYLYAQISALAASFLLLFGNEMLLTSFYTSCLFVVLSLVHAEPFTRRIPFIARCALQGFFVLVGTVATKILVGSVLGIRDDEHIGDILASKFSTYRTWDTMLYTCAPEFDFLAYDTYVLLCKTLAVPACLVAVTLVIWRLVGDLVVNYYGGEDPPVVKVPVKNGQKRQPLPSQKELEPNKPYAELVYHLLQLIAYTIMAALIMRLKLFWTPYVCLTTSLLASQSLCGRYFRSIGMHRATVALLLAGMAVQGTLNVQKQLKVRGEFSNWPMEETMTWIKDHTSRKAVFAGPMPTMATVKLVTGRPIVNHPHYEDAGLRARTKSVYSIYSRKDTAEAWRRIRQLGADYLLLEMHWCGGREGTGCMMAELWDLEDASNRGREPICKRIERVGPTGRYFERIFKSGGFQLYRIRSPEEVDKGIGDD